MQIITSWMEEGIVQGIERGKQAEARSLTMRQLARKVGTITLELQQSLEKLSLIQLEDLAVNLLDFSNIADLETWLQQIPIEK